MENWIELMELTCLALSLLIASTAAAESPDKAGNVALTGIAADLGSTALGLSLGAAEANPLGLAIVPLKFLVKQHIEQVPDQHERRNALARFTGAQFGAAAANVCTLLLANPVLSTLCFVGGVAFGYDKVRSIQTSEEVCVSRHMPMFEAALATGRIYKVELKTCTGRFEPANFIAASHPVADGTLVAQAPSAISE